MKKWIVFTPILVIAAGIGVLQINKDQAPASAPSPTSIRTPTSTPTRTAAPAQTPSTRVLNTVPFAAQAPFGNWSDPRQQDGCEEASVLMAMKWVRAESMTLEEALEELLELSAFSEATYGTYHDTSIRDTFRFFSGFYNHREVTLETDVTVDAILKSLRGGSLIIVPTNGRILNNPNYTDPGPEHHMLVIIGFDGTTQEFITNDPGTRQGKSYRYSYSRLYDAIADYPTGMHLPRTGEEKVMIVVSK